MPGHDTHQPHGSGIRGLNSLLNIDGHQGRFGRMFPDLSPGQFDEADLQALAAKMVSTPDAPKDDPDDEESHVPAAYTYFGQFVDHDLTFDPSTFEQQKSDPDGIIDFRSPRFDMDNVYGRGPGDQPYLYDGFRFMVGDPLTNAARNPDARDLARAAPNSAGGRRAIIGDPRNDENVIVSQLQGMMVRFHNRVLALNPGLSFDEVQREVRWHYQWVVVHDFLTRIVEKSVLDSISKAIVDPHHTFASNPPMFRFYCRPDAYLPVEFSVAAYRMGHSMVRPAYRVNEVVPPLPIFDAAAPSLGLNAFGDFNKGWAIDWQRFIDLGLPQPGGDITDRVQLAYKLDTSLVDPLGKLPNSVAGEEADPAATPPGDAHLRSLAFRNLERGVKLLLPTGQGVARAMGLKPLSDAHILIGKALHPTIPADSPTKITDISPAFADNCPLWTYVLAESRHNWVNHGQARLGAVGGRIVAETFLGLLRRDPNSYLSKDPYWRPSLGIGGAFTLADLLRAALQA